MTMQALIVDEWPCDAELERVLKELGVEVTRQGFEHGDVDLAQVKMSIDASNFSTAALIAMTSTTPLGSNRIWPHRTSRPYLKRKK